MKERLVALKFPHGPKGVAWNASSGRFEPEGDINAWLARLYAQSSWKGWLCYNDLSPASAHTTKGHCKGILTWNEARIGWLIHSVPHFPRDFLGSSLSAIEPSELMYGQSFLYCEQSRAVVKLEDVLRQLMWMKANVFHAVNMPTVAPYNKAAPLEIKSLRWSATMVHLAKAPRHATDFIGTELTKLDGPWYEESWKRGGEYAENDDASANNRVVTIHRLSVEAVSFNSSQDHSKWAASPSRVWIGDLNHMKSQEHRGGGGMVIQYQQLAKAFRAWVTTV